jgi:glutathione S-transferase
MRTLYHHTLLASARKVRLVLSEKRLPFDEKILSPWDEPTEELARLNPACDLPVLVDEDGTVVCDAGVICEYLDEKYPDPPLIGQGPAARAETRRLTAWFDQKFYHEVTQPLAGEKLINRVLGHAPDSRLLKLGREQLLPHLYYIGVLTEERGWLAGELLSMADLTAAANISLVDYAGDVPWEQAPATKEWYVRVKSRPSFRALLKDSIPGVPPAAVYADLDF